MPVFFRGRHRILFIHVPKAGGTSIEAFFEANGFKTAYLDRGGAADSLNPVRRSSPQHMTAEVLAALFKPEKFDFVFMTVRHPIRRLLSKFAMERASGGTRAELEPWLAEMMRLVGDEPGAMDNHLRPQSDFRLPGSHVFKLEDGFGEAFIARLEAGIGLQFSQRVIRRDMHAGPHAPDYDSVDPDLRQHISNYYAIDFKSFSY